MGELSKLLNIGKEIERQLIEVGIDTEEKLKKIGAKQAWLKIKAKDSSACYNQLCALEGAIEGIRRHNLKEDTKKDLKEFYNDFK